jgi:hypothetical protein
MLFARYRSPNTDIRPSEIGGRGLFAAAYIRRGEVVSVKGRRLGVWRRPLQVGEPLPTLPLPLSLHQSAMIDLEQTYQRAAGMADLT